MGSFTIRLRKAPYTDRRFSFCVVPGLGVSFDRRIYLPHEAGRAPTVRAATSADDLADIALEAPARLEEVKDNTYKVSIDGEEDALRLTLCLAASGGDSQRIPLTVDVPKVRWRLHGLVESKYAIWRDTVDEVWLGDLWATAPELFLVVGVPPFVDGRLELALCGDSSKTDECQIREGKVGFDLLAFGDALRTGPSVQTLTITLRDSQLSMEQVPLFGVRISWEVVDLECVQSIQGRTIVLEVSWAERGKTDGKEKVIRLWSSSSSVKNPVVEASVPEGEQTVTLTRSAKDLQPGVYLLELALRDPWSATHVSLRPSKNAPNTFLIHIVSPGDLRQGNVFTILSIADYNGKPYELVEPCRIKVLGKIVNRELPLNVEGNGVLLKRVNEGWYVGELISTDPDWRAELTEANPVKFDYSASRDFITAIEDRDGDGAMYCRQCRRLFWSQEVYKEELGRGHALLGPIEESRITWEPWSKQAKERMSYVP